MQKQLDRTNEKKDKERNQDKFVSIGDPELAESHRVLMDMKEALGEEIPEAPDQQICHCMNPSCGIGYFIPVKSR